MSLFWFKIRWSGLKEGRGGKDAVSLAANGGHEICSNNWKHDRFSLTDACGILVYPSLSAEFVKCIILLVLKFSSHLFAGGKREQISHDGLPNFPRLNKPSFIRLLIPGLLVNRNIYQFLCKKRKRKQKYSAPMTNVKSMIVLKVFHWCSQIIISAGYSYGNCIILEWLEFF